MSVRLACYLGIAVLSAAALPLPASAQALPPYEIATSVRSLGLDPIGEPVLRGPRYVLRAIDGRGVEVRIFADARTGRVLFAEPVGYPGRGGAYAERSYPPGGYPEEGAPPPRGGYERQGSYDRPGYQQQGSYGHPPSNPGDPSVIYAPRENGAAPPPARPPVAAKPPVPRMSAKPPVKPVEAPKQEATRQEEPVKPEEAATQQRQAANKQQEAAKTPVPSGQTPADATGTTGGPNGPSAAPPSPPPEKNPALTAPPVQAFD